MKLPKHKHMNAIPVSNWHLWFAWRPVRTWDGRLVWLRTVLRRRLQWKPWVAEPFDSWFEYHYDKGYVEDEQCNNVDRTNA